MSGTELAQVKELVVTPVVEAVHSEMGKLRAEIQGHLDVGSARMDAIAKSVNDVQAYAVCVNETTQRVREDVKTDLATAAATVRTEFIKHDNRLKTVENAVTRLRSRMAQVAVVFGLIGSVVGAACTILWERVKKYLGW
jgi:CRISPR/Cas system-associated exonuclease Cas4 (RecB family)